MKKTMCIILVAIALIVVSCEKPDLKPDSRNLRTVERDIVYQQ